MPEDPARCTKPTPTTWIDGLDPAPVCPVRGVPRWGWLLSAWRWCTEGRLPRSGGVLDQPAWLMDALDVVGGVVAAQRARERPSGSDQ